MIINGVINVKKEKGMTSFGVVSRLRKLFGQKKIGHTGTLDPDAEGVLPVCFGRATHLVESLSRGTKSYEAVLLLGMETDTQDAGGAVLAEREVLASDEEIRAAVESFRGKQTQIPPMYSALKVNGKKLVDLARRGIEVERKPREVEFFEIELLWILPPRAAFRVTCTHGTYIRTLCHDIGAKLGCGGCMESLLRTRVGDFPLEDALTLSEIAERKAGEDEARPAAISDSEKSRFQYSFIRSIDSFYAELPAVTVRGKALRSVLHGSGFLPADADGEREAAEVRAYTPEGEFIGIYKRKGAWLSLEKFFYEDRKESL